MFTLAVLLLVCAGLTALGILFLLLNEKDPGKRTVSAMVNIFMVVVMVLSAVAMIG